MSEAGPEIDRKYPTNQAYLLFTSSLLPNISFYHLMKIHAHHTSPRRIFQKYPTKMRPVCHLPSPSRCSWPKGSFLLAATAAVVATIVKSLEPSESMSLTEIKWVFLDFDAFELVCREFWRRVHNPRSGCQSPNFCRANKLSARWRDTERGVVIVTDKAGKQTNKDVATIKDAV